METSPIAEAERLYKNDVIYEKSHDILISATADIHFIFETESDTVKVPANRACLAASSPVFNAMFNGELKEEGDVKIVDVSSAAFKEFLQFFYEHQVKLTIDNISDVLKLVDYYDVVDGLPICINFLKERLTFNDLVWGLDLAIKCCLDELKAFCKDEIGRNYQTVLDQIHFDEDGQLVASNDRASEIDWNTVLPHIYMVSQSVIRNISDQLEQKSAVYCVTLSAAESSWHKLTENETTVFSLDKAMMLTDIVCSKISEYGGPFIERSFSMTIERKTNVSTWYSETVYEEKIVINRGLNCVKLSAPVLIESNYVYAINFRSKRTELHYTSKSIVDNGTTVALAPNVNISFLGKYDKSLVSVLYFIHLAKN